MIWHIFRKDLRMSWKPALGAAVLQWISIALIVKMGMFQTSRSLEQLHGMVRIAAGLATLVVAIVAVHNDVLTLPTGDWLMRPIKRRDMVLAKILFFVAAMQLPILVGCVGEGMAFGFSFGESFLAALWQSAMLTVGFGVPAVAVGAMTANLVEAIVLVVIGVSIAVAQSWLSATLIYSQGGWLFNPEWIEASGLTFGMCAAGIVGLIVLYRWRKATQARFASIAIFVLGTVCALVPWKTAFALEQWITPSSGAAANIRLAFDGAPRNSRGTPFTDSAFLPIRADGLPAGAQLMTDHVEVKLTRPDGSVEHPQLHITQFVAERGGLDIVSGGGDSVTVSADYWLTLLEDAGSYWVETGDRDTVIPGMGRCRIGMAPDRWSENVGCVNVGPANGICYSLTDRRTAIVPFCRNYAPSYFWSPDWDELSRMQSSAMTAEGVPQRTYVSTYRIAEHFIRHVEIPNVRLAAWK